MRFHCTLAKHISQGSNDHFTILDEKKKKGKERTEVATEAYKKIMKEFHADLMHDPSRQAKDDRKKKRLVSEI